MRGVTGHNALEAQPSFSPDGTAIAYWQPRNGDSGNVNEILVSPSTGGPGKSITRALDAYRADYTIDVSSPGPERPVRKQVHFAAAIGRHVSLRTNVQIDGRTRIRGEVITAGDDAVTVETAEAKTLQVPYDSIVRGNLIDEGLTT